VRVTQYEKKKDFVIVVERKIDTQWKKRRDTFCDFYQRVNE